MDSTIDEPMDVHEWFNLTYSNYMVLHRTLLQSMPEEWQYKFIELVREMNRAFDHIERADAYRVTPIDPTTGRFVREPVPHYNRGRTFIEPKL